MAPVATKTATAVQVDNSDGVANYARGFLLAAGRSALLYMKLSGTLSKYGLIDLLRVLQAELVTGKLDLRAGDDHVELFFDKGNTVLARSGAVRHSYPAFLLRHRILDRDALKELLDRATQIHQPLEKLLVESGVLDELHLRASKLGMARYILCFAFGMAPSTYRLVRMAPPPSGLPELSLDPEIEFFRFVALRDATIDQQAELNDVMDQTVYPTPLMESRLAKVREAFTGSATGSDPILDSIEASAKSIQALIGRGFASEDVTRRVFALHKAGLVRFDSGVDWDSVWNDAFDEHRLTGTSTNRGFRGMAPGNNTILSTTVPGVGENDGVSRAQQALRAVESTDSRNRTPPSKSRAMPAGTPETPAGPGPGGTSLGSGIEDVLLELQDRMTHQTLYDVLGVTPDAPLSEIRENYRYLRTKYDPAAYEEFLLSPEAREALRSIADRLEQAYRTLTDQRRRSSYNSGRKIENGVLRATVESIFGAESLAQQAAEALKSGQFQHSANIYREALRHTPYDATLHADLAWAIFQGIWKGGLPEADHRSEVDNELAHAMRYNPRSEQALRVRARIARLEGRPRDAIEAYQRVLALNPQSQEARRALRELKNSDKRDVLQDDQGSNASVISLLSGIFRKK